MATGSSILDLVNAYKGLKGSSTTQTTSSNLSQAGVDGLIRQILESNQGLATVASGGKGAGLYNSSTQKQLVNDLLTQTATKVASAQGGTTTKTTTNGAVSKSDAKNGLILMLGKSLLGPTVSSYAKKNGLDLDKSLGDHISDYLGADNTTGDFGASDAYSSSLSDLGQAGRDAVGGVNFVDLLGEDAGRTVAESGSGDALGDFITGLGL